MKVSKLFYVSLIMGICIGVTIMILTYGIFNIKLNEPKIILSIIVILEILIYITLVNKLKDIWNNVISYTIPKQTISTLYMRTENLPCIKPTVSFPLIK